MRKAITLSKSYLIEGKELKEGTRVIIETAGSVKRHTWRGPAKPLTSDYDDFEGYNGARYAEDDDDILDDEMDMAKRRARYATDDVSDEEFDDMMSARRAQHRARPSYARRPARYAQSRSASAKNARMARFSNK